MSDASPMPATVLFDMDGTLTAPMLDFPAIKAEMGIGDRPILEALADLSGPRRAAAEGVLLRHEEHAAEHSTLNPGCRELLDWLADHGIRTALITRNSRRSAQTVVERHRLSLAVLVTREDGPFKPDPFPLRLACQRLEAGADETWMVGDGQYDVEAAHAAGIRSIWLSHGRVRPFAAVPWREVRDLIDIRRALESCAAAAPRDR